MRKDRANDQLRNIEFEVNINPYAEGSCLAKFGHSHLYCTATIEETVPPFLRHSGTGWVTAEYAMLPRSTHNRIHRKQSIEGARSQEISRLIGRSLRAVTDLGAFGERQIRIDCDVIQADGGTRTAAITGGFIALYFAFHHLQKLKVVEKIPLSDYVAAISCGVLEDNILLDLDYQEDSRAIADSNFVITGRGELVEVQASGEKSPISESQFSHLLDLGKKGCSTLIQLQRKATMTARN